MDIVGSCGMIRPMIQRSFHELWQYDVDAFIEEAKGSHIPVLVSDDTMKTIYWLLMAEYANSTIASYDEKQFKYQVFATIFRYAPTWEKRMEIQKKLRELTDEEVFQAGRQVINRADHPGTVPSTASLEELMFIQDQTSVINKRDKLTGYNTLAQLLETDVTQAFIGEFKKLFRAVVAPERYPLFKNTIEEEEDNDQ